MNSNGKNSGFLFRRHLNKLRWIVLIVVFATLVYLPYVSLYQNFVAAHAYDLLTPSQKQLYDVMEILTAPFGNNPEKDLDVIKGTTWSATIYGLQLSDPLAAVAHMSANLTIYKPLFRTILIPVILTVAFGRFFCGWICPASLLYELNTNLAVLLQKIGLSAGSRRFDPRFKFVVLGVAMVFGAAKGSVILASIYPPAVVGRELQYAIALGGFGAGAAFFAVTLLFDFLVTRRGFCRYLCPGGAVYAILGRFRFLRIRRSVEKCNDCTSCNAVCEFGLDPMRDAFGPECNNCTACIATCQPDALSFVCSVSDIASQGPGHQGPNFK